MQKAKYYYRVDGENHPIPGTLVRLKERPITGKWREVSANPCCDAPTGPVGTKEVTLRNYSLETITVSGILSGSQALGYMVDTPATVYDNNILKFSNGVGFPMTVQLWLEDAIVNSQVINNNQTYDLGTYVFDTIRIME